MWDVYLELEKIGTLNSSNISLFYATRINNGLIVKCSTSDDNVLTYVVVKTDGTFQTKTLSGIQKGYENNCVFISEKFYMYRNSSTSSWITIKGDDNIHSVDDGSVVTSAISGLTDTGPCKVSWMYGDWYSISGTISEAVSCFMFNTSTLQKIQNCFSIYEDKHGNIYKISLNSDGIYKNDSLYIPFSTPSSTMLAIYYETDDKLIIKVQMNDSYGYKLFIDGSEIQLPGSDNYVFAPVYFNNKLDGFIVNTYYGTEDFGYLINLDGTMLDLNGENLSSSDINLPMDNPIYKFILNDKPFFFLNYDSQYVLTYYDDALLLRSGGMMGYQRCRSFDPETGDMIIESASENMETGGMSSHFYKYNYLSKTSSEIQSLYDNDIVIAYKGLILGKAIYNSDTDTHSIESVTGKISDYTFNSSTVTFSDSSKLELFI